MTAGKEPKVNPVIDGGKLYLYLSQDGVTRLRCGRHVARAGRLAPQRIWKEVKVGYRTCVECAYEERDGAFLDALEEAHD